MSETFGLSQQNLKLIENILFSVMQNKLHFSVYVFGSRALGRARQYSDLDLWIHSEPFLSAEDISKLREEFEDSDLPIKIDIVTPETCLDEYKSRIEQEKVLWYSLNV